MFADAEDYARFRAAWDAVRIARPVSLGLFTFGESELPYFLVLPTGVPKTPISVKRGEVRVTRPMIITPDNAPPELQNFFEDHGEELAASHLLARSASFRHLKLDNRTTSQEVSSDSVEEVVDRLNRQLDREEEDRVAILVAPAPLAGIALLRYVTDRIIESAPGNLQELRERGFLP
jgi:hypothetical protein